jgi:cytochrome c-type biogenesis protein CcmH/NrfG
VVEIEVTGGVITFRVLGLHKLWALRSSVRVPLRSIVEAQLGEAVARELWKGWRLPGTAFPGVITAGSYLKSGEWTFWDVVHPAKSLLVTLRDHRYARLVVEVADPSKEMRRINEARR